MEDRTNNNSLLEETDLDQNLVILLTSLKMGIAKEKVLKIKRHIL